jgi:hypothetical protein
MMPIFGLRPGTHHGPKNFRPGESGAENHVNAGMPILPAASSGASFTKHFQPDLAEDRRLARWQIGEPGGPGEPGDGSRAL